MSRWDPEPTSFQRWTALHRKGVRIGATLMMVLAICGLLNDVVTVGLDGAIVGPAVALSTSLSCLLLSSKASRFVEKYDDAQQQQDPIPR